MRIWGACACFAVVAILAPQQPQLDSKGMIRIARESVRAAIAGETSTAVTTKTPSKPVFVTIEIQNQVRGCRGALETRKATLEEEIAEAARSAAAHDPRYRPLETKDLASFLVTVTVIEKLEPIDSVDGLQPKHGLVLKSGSKTGVVLPWEGKDPQTRLKWAYKKAGVKPGEEASLFVLIAERYRG